MDQVRALSLQNLKPDRVCQVESYCVPNFDSPSIFARILDKNKVIYHPSGMFQLNSELESAQGGHFSITPIVPFTTKQNYLPSSNVWLSPPFHCIFE